MSLWIQIALGIVAAVTFISAAVVTAWVLFLAVLVHPGEKQREKRLAGLREERGKLRDRH